MSNAVRSPVRIIDFRRHTRIQQQVTGIGQGLAVDIDIGQVI